MFFRYLGHRVHTETACFKSSVEGPKHIFDAQCRRENIAKPSPSVSNVLECMDCTSRDERDIPWLHVVQNAIDLHFKVSLKEEEGLVLFMVYMSTRSYTRFNDVFETA